MSWCNWRLSDIDKPNMSPAVSPASHYAPCPANLSPTCTPSDVNEWTRTWLMLHLRFVFVVEKYDTLPVRVPQDPSTYRRATNREDMSMCNMRTLRTHTIRRACFCPLGFAKLAAYQGSRPHPVALDTDRFSEIVPETVPCPIPSLESRTCAVEGRWLAAAEILVSF